MLNYGFAVLCLTLARDVFPLESLGRQTFNHPTIRRMLLLTRHVPEHYDEQICDGGKEKGNSVSTVKRGGSGDWMMKRNCLM